MGPLIFEFIDESMFDIPFFPKPMWSVFLIIIGAVILVWNGTFQTLTKTDGGPVETMIDASKTVCVAKDAVMEELLQVAYEESSYETRKIVDKFRKGENLSDCDYFQIYKILNKKNLKSWVLDESCNFLVCSGI